MSLSATKDSNMESCLVKDESCSSVPAYFPFPFPPYDIQEDFMKNLYMVLDKGGIGIFESPTGTGKSLSLICGALTWLRDFEAKRQEDLSKGLSPKDLDQSDVSMKDESKSGDDDLPAWVLDFGAKKKQQELEDQLRAQNEKLEKQKAHLMQVKQDSRKSFVLKGKRKHSEEQTLTTNESKKEDQIQGEIDDLLGKSAAEDPDVDIILKEYHSDDENDDDDKCSDDEDEEVHCTKIYYCSRTHSQLAQFTREVIKSPYGEATSLVTLGSRQNFCINEDVKKLKSNTRINDRCLELQKNKKKDKVEVEKTESGKVTKKKKTTAGCPYNDYKQQQNFRDQLLIGIKDIEQLVSLGEDLHACPYYGTRQAIPAAKVVCLPYNMLLHKSTRQACGIKLEGNIVIIDEAHNLLETINNIHSVEISGAQISGSFSQLSQYLDRYRTRLKAKNVMYIKQILFILSRFLSCLGGKATELGKPLTQQEPSKAPFASKPDVQLKTINDFLFSSQIDNVNLFKIGRYCHRSMISKKLNGFVDKYRPQEVFQESSQSDEPSYQSFTSPMHFIENFLEALTNADVDGRVVVNRQDRVSTSSIKFLLLNPAVNFNSVVQESKAVIVAGGTMQPTSEFKDQLFACAGVSPDLVHEFSCGHVISPEQLLTIALGKGPSGLELDFTYQSRDSPQLIEECGRVLLNTCAVIPGGVVCFFSSFDYAQKIYSHWEKSGILEKLGTRKKIFTEPRKASQVEQVLSSFSALIKKTSASVNQGTQSQVNGAILLCVVGGKMSEGINFSDDLGRCVVMIGLPYPNINSPELKEKMNYLNTNIGAKAGQEYYENLCMKAVNQSIGRAIRHRQDYATILLLDHRYSTPRVYNKLPSWIGSRMQHYSRFGPAFAAVRKFFVDKRSCNKTTTMAEG
ncbi:ATP-dependent DNA helicase DDX11-like [Actinia tenebrosa]|uniref:ATP-dependent DNA helicase DDX11-like n=1 Tax=Actinia tenebrosa TaxID=6105 RepID=A0A6P8HCT0_ACTTE|nr:ATP-dependent DNA helicase DDX11-like [Actinia tenebrosa]